jgi:hypothetical protein
MAHPGEIPPIVSQSDDGKNPTNAALVALVRAMARQVARATTAAASSKPGKSNDVVDR